MKGRLTRGSQIASGSRVTLASSIEMPVTPPSMKLLDSRKPFSPMPAERMPSTIRPAFNISRSTRAMRDVLSHTGGVRVFSGGLRSCPRDRARADLVSAPHLFLHDRPRRAQRIGQLGQVLRREPAFGGRPGRLHARPIVPVELDHRVPSGMLPVGIGRHVVLYVSAQAGQPFGQSAVVFPQDLAKPLPGQIRAPVEDDHELHHETGPGTRIITRRAPTGAGGSSLASS